MGCSPRGRNSSGCVLEIELDSFLPNQARMTRTYRDMGQGGGPSRRHDGLERLAHSGHVHRDPVDLIARLVIHAHLSDQPDVAGAQLGESKGSGMTSRC